MGVSFLYWCPRGPPHHKASPPCLGVMMIWKQKKNLVMILEISQVIGNYHWFWSLEIITNPHKFLLELVKDPRRGGLALWWGVGLKKLLARNGVSFLGVFLENCFVHDGAFLQFFFNNSETSRLEILLRFCSKHQKNVLDYSFYCFCVLGSIFGGVCGSFG